MIGKAILIAGPTASGKSALALEMARQRHGVVVNADSMQVYSVLRLLTARPDAAQMEMAPHLLYGHVHPRENYSTGQWLRDVCELAEAGAFRDRIPVFVGGTGLYFRALLGGLAPMPAIPPDITERWRRRLGEEGPQELHRVLQKEDAEAALKLKSADGQRIVRALEVLEASGRSILAWQAETPAALVDRDGTEMILLDPERKLLAERIEGRFDHMMEDGAAAEVEILLSLRLDQALPAMKAIGVREIAAALGGRLAMDEAIERAKAATRQYAKRQGTWFRHQAGPEWERRPV
ncbi:MAG: tRNA (adenosine(37)-N6)-dimethylallyltransferase MiaA [Hyphomicrobiales bacterium]|nr:tRNA (adenosine(37)-N6)-dimethylallyltransferase MiaA [Hyphomicrobiales bacterium]